MLSKLASRFDFCSILADLTALAIIVLDRKYLSFQGYDGFVSRVNVTDDSLATSLRQTVRSDCDSAVKIRV